MTLQFGAPREALEEAGASRDKARLAAEGVAGFHDGAVADLRTDVEGLRGEFSALRAGVRGGIAAVRAEMRADLTTIRAELAIPRGEMQAGLAAHRGEQLTVRAILAINTLLLLGVVTRVLFFGLR